MSSILTNSSAMVALDTLRNINRDLASVTNEISTGKSVSNAKDNAAIWAISTVMSTDVESFKQISDSLNLGSSTVGVARSASEQVTSLLQDVKGKIVAAQESNVDRTKIQTDIDELTKQITSVVGAAQFNGLNLLNGSSTADMDILSSLDRSSSGTVAASFISVARQDLSLSNTATAATFGGTAVTDTSIIDNGGTNAGTADSVADAATQAITIASVADGNSYRLLLDDSAGANSIGQRTFEYVAGTNTGGLGNLATVDVTTDAGAASALTAIEGLLQTSIDAAASFGSSQNRIENQTDFVSSLIDSMTTGIGGLTDADMEAASAKLQALQVQQQLGAQALSIANQAPQALLSLFR